MGTYSTPKQGTYYFSIPIFYGMFKRYSTPVEVIECLCEEVESVPELKKLINNIFSDDIKGIMLSTIHKAKGLENDRIFFLAPELIPSKYATQPWQHEQEQNLRYVAITRAKKELIYVWGNIFIQDIKNKVIISKI